MPHTPSSLQRISDLDLALCLRCNRVSHYRFWRLFFKTQSRLGDGVFWYLFAFLVAVSRPVLGLHYPSDVLAGALLGTLVAQFVTTCI